MRNQTYWWTQDANLVLVLLFIALGSFLTGFFNKLGEDAADYFPWLKENTPFIILEFSIIAVAFVVYNLSSHTKYRRRRNTKTRRKASST